MRHVLPVCCLQVEAQCAGATRALAQLTAKFNAQAAELAAANSKLARQEVRQAPQRVGHPPHALVRSHVDTTHPYADT